MPGPTSGPATPPAPGPAWRLRPQGDRCISIELGDRIAVQTGLQCLSLAAALRAAGLPGVTDVVPSFTAVALHYGPAGPLGGGAFEQRAGAVREVLALGLPEAASGSREIDIPVCYGAGHGPDLGAVAQACGLSEAEVVRRHGLPGALVFMLGFAPGHPYIGLHDEALNLPRREVPRTAVAAGSVAIANRQTVIYPNRLPGGWHVIGATPLSLFDPGRSPPTLLMPGDRVRFVPITAAQFDGLAGRAGAAGDGGASP